MIVVIIIIIKYLNNIKHSANYFNEYFLEELQIILIIILSVFFHKILITIQTLY